LELSVAVATDADAAAIALLRTRTADQLTGQHGRGPWSWGVTENAVLRDIKSSRVLVARAPNEIVGTLRLQTTKPWSIDVAYFQPVGRPLYIVDMAVEPRVQRRGIGRFLLSAALDVARDWPADAVRLDAFDHAAGAGPFYVKCGFHEVGRSTYRGVPRVDFERLLS
jgi:GNAT superfamily N-acetyltransferase